MFLRRRRILRRGLVGVVLWVGGRGRREGVRRVSLGHGRGALRGIGIGRRVGRVDQVGEIHDARYENLFEGWAGCDDDHPFPCPSMRRPLCAPTLQQHTSQSLSISLATGVRTRMWPRVQCDMVLGIAARLSRRSSVETDLTAPRRGRRLLFVSEAWQECATVRRAMDRRIDMVDGRRCRMRGRIWNYIIMQLCFSLPHIYSGRQQQLLLGVDFESATWKMRE
jgi:hypothetical protein